MADRIRYNVDFNINQQQINQLKAELQSLQNLSVSTFSANNPGIGLQEAKKQIESIHKSASQLETVFNKAFNTNLGTLNLKTFNAELNKLSNNTLARINADLSKAGVTGLQAFSKMSSAIMSTNLQLRESHQILDKIGITLANSFKWSAASSIVNRMANSVQTAWNYTKALDSSLNDIRIVTGKSADEMDRFAVTANRAAQKLGNSTKDFTNAALIYYQQGLNDEESNKRAEVTLKAANVTGQSTSTVSEQLTAVWNGYNVSVEDSERYIDKLAAVAATTAADLEELSTGMSKVASAASIMGVDIDQLSAQLATIVSVTRQAPESVGTALKTIYARMGDIESGLDDETTLGNYTEQMAELGVNVLNSSGRLRDMGEVIEEVGGKWDSYSREQQVALSQIMAGTRQYNNLLALFNNWDMYEGAVKTSKNSLGTLEEQNKIFLDRTTTHIQQFETAWERVFDSFTDNKGINSLIDLFTNLTLGIANFTEALGGGGNVLLTFGGIATQVFSKQISESINTSIKNLTAEKNNIAEIESRISALQALITQNEKNKDTTPNRSIQLQIEQLQQLKENIKGFSVAQIEDISNTIKKYGEMATQVDIVKEKVAQAKQFLERGYGNNYSKETTDSFVDTGKINSNYLLEGLIADDKRQIQQTEVNIKNLTESMQNYYSVVSKGGNVAKAQERAMNSVKGIIKEVANSWRTNGLVTEESTKKIEIALKGLEDEDLSNFFSEKDGEKLRARFERLLATLKEVIGEIKGEFGNLSDIITNGGGTAWLGKSQKEEEDVRKTLNNIWDDTAQQKMIQGMVQVTGAVTSMTAAFQTFMNIGNIWNNENLSSGEKILQLTMSISMATGQMINGGYTLMKQLPEVKLGLQKLAFAQLGEAEAAAVGSAANMGFSATLKGVGKAALSALAPLAPYIALVAAVGTVAYIAVKAWNADADAAKKDAEAVDKLKESYQKVTEELENFQDQIKDYSSATESIKKLTKGTNEYRKALLEANNKALELLKTNKELAQYAYRNDEGLIVISQEGLNKVTEQYIQSQEQIQSNLYEAQSKAATSQLKSDMTDFKRQYGSYYVTDNETKDQQLGQYGQGNIDLWNRPIYKQDDGSISTVNSYSFWDEDEQKEILVPLIQKIGDDIVQVSEEEAQKIYKQNGEYLGKFDSAGEAIDYANLLHEAQDYRYNRNRGESGSQRISDDILYKIADYMSENNLTNLVKTDIDKIESIAGESSELKASIAENIDAYVNMANSINNTKKEQQLYADAIAEARLKLALGDKYNNATKSEQNTIQAIYHRKNDDVEKKTEDTEKNKVQYNEDAYNNFMAGAGDNPMAISAYADAYTSGRMFGNEPYDVAKDYSDLRGYEGNPQYHFFRGGYSFHDAEGNEVEFIKNGEITDKIGELITEIQYAKEAEEEAPQLIGTINEFTETLKGQGIDNTNVLNYLLKSGNSDGDKKFAASQKTTPIYKYNDKGEIEKDENGNPIISEIDVAGTMSQKMAQGFLDRFTSEEGKEQLLGTLNNSDFWKQQGFESAEQYYNALIEWLQNRANTSDAESLSLDFIKTNQSAARTVEEQALAGELNPRQTTEEYKTLAQNIEQIRDLYPELTNEIDTFTNKGMIGTQQWFQSLYEIEQKLNELKLDGLTEEYEKKLKELEDVKNRFIDEESGEIDIEAMLDSTDFQDAMDALLNADYDINVEIHAQAEKAFENFETATKNMATQAAKIGENYVVAADDIRALNNAFPGIINGMEAVGDGSVKLKDTVVQSAMEAAEAEMQASAQSTLDQLEKQADILRAKRDTYKSMGDAAMALAKHEGNVEENKAKITEGFEKLKDLNNEATANKEKERDQQVADNSKENGAILAQNWASAYESAANSAIAFAETAVSAHQVAVNGEGTAKKGDFGVTYQGNNGKSSEAAGLAELESAAGKAQSDEDWESIANQFYNAATIAGRGANDIEGMIAQIGARSVETGKALSNIAKGKGANPKKGSEKDPDKMDKVDDEPDRYHKVNTQLDKIENHLEKISSQEKKLIGVKLINNLNGQLDQLDKRIDRLREKVGIAQGEAKELKDKLAPQGVTFNDDGTIANYMEIYNSKLNYVNSLIDKYNSMSADEQKSFKSVVEAAKKDYEQFKKDLDRYDELVSDFIPGLENDIQDAIDEEIELNIKKFNLEFDVRLNIADAQKDWNEFKKKILDDIDDDDILGNARARATDDLGVYLAGTDGKDGLLGAGLKQTERILKELNDMDTKGWSNVYGDDRVSALEDLQEAYQNVEQSLMEIKDIQKDVAQAVLDMMDEVVDAMDRVADLMDTVDSQIEHDIKLIELVYGETDYDAKGKYMEQRQQNNLDTLATAKANRDFWEQEMNLIDDKTSEAYKKAQDNFFKYNDAVNDAIEKSIEDAQEKAENAIDGIFDKFNKAITDGKGLDYTEQQWELVNDVADQYLDTVNAAFGIRQLEGKWKDAIDNTDSVTAQRKLNDLMEQQLSKLREKDKLTQYDIDRAEKEYEIALKRLELEEAQQNKTTMRLRRDSQGNYRYEYVADEDQIAKLQDELDVLENSLYNFDKERWLEMQNQVVDAVRERQEAIKEILMDASLTEEERLERLEEINRLYNQKIQNITDQAVTAQNNLYDSGAKELEKIWDEQGKNFQDLSDEEQRILVEEMLPQFETGVNEMIDKFSGPGGFEDMTTDSMDALMDATEDYLDDLADVEQQAGITFDEIRDGQDDVLDMMPEMISDAEDYVDVEKDEYQTLKDINEELQKKLKYYQDIIGAAKSAAQAAYEYWQKEQQIAAEQYAQENAKKNQNAGGNNGNTSGSSSGSGSGSGSSAGSGAGSGSGSGTLTTGTVGTYSGKYYYDSFGTSPAGSVASGVKDAVQVDIINNNPYGIHIKGAGSYSRYTDLGWIKKSQLSGYETGGYTGDWVGDYGKLALLHSHETILNAGDTDNLLDMVQIARDVVAVAGPGGSLSRIRTPDGTGDILEQNVHIEANFPNVESVDDIREALNSLVNMAAQRANRNGRG